MIRYILITFFIMFAAAGCINPLSSIGANKLAINPSYSTTEKPGAFSFISSGIASQEVRFEFSSSEGASEYVVKYGTSSGNYNLTSSCTSSPCSITNLTNNTDYFFTVLAINSAGTTSISGELGLSPIPLAIPDTLSAMGATHSVNLSWAAVAGAASYKVYRSTISGNYTLVTPLEVYANGHIDSSVTPGTTYYYVVTAVRGGNETGQSLQVTSRPVDVPTTLIASGGITSIGLSWGAVAGASYNIYRSTSSGNYSLPLVTGLTATTYTDTSAVFDVPYYYIVRAVSTNSLSDASNEVSKGIMPTVHFSVVSQNASEGVGTLNVQLTLSSASAHTVTVPVTYSGTAIGPARYTGPANVVINAGATTANLALTIVDGTAEELDQTIIATLGTPINAFLGTNTVNTTTLKDNDFPLVTVSDITITEGSQATFTVTMNRTSIRNVNYNFSTINDSALSGTNYLSLSGSDSITAGQTTKTYNIITYPDVTTPTSSVVKEFDFELSSVTNASSSSVLTATATIDKPKFFLPLTNSLIASRPLTGVLPVYSRTDTQSYVASVTDFEGILRLAKNGEARFSGARRVENFVPFSENLSTNWGGNATSRDYFSTGGPLNNGYTRVVYTGAQYVNLAASHFTNKVVRNKEYQMSAYMRTNSANTGGTTVRISQEGNLCLSCAYSAVTLTSTWRRYTYKFTTGNSGTVFFPLFYHFSGDSAVPTTVDIASVQIEDVSGQANQTPGEYVSCGVMASPFNGAGVDCVKYFDSYNGNTYNVASGLVTEANGLKIPAAQNLLLYSNKFDDWNSFNPSVFTANAGIAPNGTNTAWNGTNSFTNSGGVSRTIALTDVKVGARYVFSIWAKRAATNSSVCAYLALILSGGSNATTAIASCPTISNQWQRVSIEIPIDYIDRTTLQFTMGNATGIAGTNILYWGAQIEKASVAGKYVPTGATPSTQYLRGFLTESARINYIEDSAHLDDFLYTNPNLVTTTAPDGSTRATEFTFNMASGQRTFIDSGFIGNAQYSASVYVKGIVGNPINTAELMVKDAVTDNIRGTSGVVKLSTTSWTRLTATGTTVGSNTGARMEIAVNTSGATAKMYIWGAQMENAPFASSYISSTGTTMARGMDELSYPLAPFINLQGTISVNYVQLGINTTTGPRGYLFEVSDGGLNRFALRISDAIADSPYFVVGNGTTNTTVASTATTQINSLMNSIYLRYTDTTARMTSNGITYTGSNGYIDGGLTSFKIGNGTTNGHRSMTIKNFKSSERVFSNEEIMMDTGF